MLRRSLPQVHIVITGERADILSWTGHPALVAAALREMADRVSEMGGGA